MALKLVVWVSDRSGEASRALQALKRHDERVARNAAVLIRDREGEVFVFESGDVDLLYWPVLGAVVGFFVKRLERSEPAHAAREQMMPLQTAFPPGSSALVILVAEAQVAGMFEFLAAFQGQAWEQALADGLLAQLAAGMASERR